ncbi:alpha/beta hydrolase fold domain-containing protein [Gryllotalpicola ginsengisoli]|uniref:alpha/beta hydrolase fold domain-containing protein n=1 Tax=Gryllotalpicola ginsengisoli TaxID=444608 RepID=UPI0003B464BF|nr:alpha/beta hydrolase fold domain-containing protein [Gryllotalpicola ginsengisoli]
MTDAFTARPSALLRLTMLALPLLRSRHTLVSEPRSRADIAASVGKRFAPPPRSAARRLSISRTRLGPLDATVIEPRGVQLSRRSLVYVHGGGYVHQFERAHWWLTSSLAHSLGVRIVAPDYRLAPTGDVVAGVSDVAAVVRVVTERDGLAPIIAGDSAGGALALSVARRLRGTSAAPAHVVLFSPWLDAALRNPEIAEFDRRDPMLAVTGVRIAGELWAGPFGVDHPDVSPVFADPSGLPPTSITIGTRDIFYPDVRDFAASARRAGVDVAVFTASDAFHVFVAATLLPESIAAGDWLKDRLTGVLRA